MKSRNDALQTRTSQYDANGRIVGQTTLAHVSPLVSFTAVNYTYDAAGNVLGYLAANADPANPTFTSTVNTLQRAEGYQQTQSYNQTRGAAGANAGVLLSQGGVAYAYDTNGHLLHTGDVGNLSITRDHSFVNDASGTALYAYYGSAGAPQQGQRQLVVNGEVLGRYGWVPDERFAGISFPVPGFTPFTQESSFSFGYQPIDGNYPAGTPGTYAVGVGDTLQGIAKGAYGDANLWYLIADANGLSGNADLKVGQVLTIPTTVRSASHAASYQPYDPSRIVGDTSATMMAMPQDKGGCGIVGQIIVVIVAVVVALYTGGAALAAMGTTVGTASTGALVAAGAVGAAAGSIASQAVGIAIGTQDKFSWKQVALSAVGGGVTAGLGGVDFGAGAIGNRVIQSAAANAVTQGIAIATGLQEGFSWRSVAASAVSAGVGQGLNAAMGYNPANGFEFGKSLVSGLASSAVGQAVRGGKVNATTLAADVFGNVLGDSLAAANRSIPGPIGAGERNTILEYFADGPGTGYSSSQSVTLRDGLTISAAENLRRIDLNRGSAYASNDMDDPSWRVMSDAGGSGVRSGITLPAPGQDGIPSKWTEDENGLTISPLDSDPVANAAEVQKPWSFEDLVNPHGLAPYNSNWQADLLRNSLRDAIVQTSRRNERVLTPIDSNAAIARQRIVNNLAGAMGGPFVDGPMQLARMAGLNEFQVQEAGILGMAAQDAIGTKGTGSATRLASGLRRIGGPRLIPNAALETELILQGNASRARIVGEIGKAAQPSIDALMRLDPNAQVGFRGSLASGLKGEHKIDAYGNRVAFDGDVAFKLNNKTNLYETYTGAQGYDADFFVVSEKLAAQLGNKSFIRAGNAARLAPSLRGVLENFDAQLRGNPMLSGMKPEAPEFRVWSPGAIERASGAPPIYFIPRGAR